MSKTNKEARDRILGRWASSIDMLAAEIAGTETHKIGIVILQATVVNSLEMIALLLKQRMGAA